MHLDLYFGFVLATTILILIPGPNVSLIMANSIAHGTRYGLLTVIGTSSAIIVQLALTVLAGCGNSPPSCDKGHLVAVVEADFAG